MIHVWQPTAVQADKFLVWSEATAYWQAVIGWQGVAQLMGQTPAVKNPTAPAVCFYVPTTSVLSLSNGLSASELKQLGETGQQYLFEDISLTPVEHLQIRYRSGIAPSRIFAKTESLHVAQSTDERVTDERVIDERSSAVNSHDVLPSSSIQPNTSLLYALSQTRIASLQNGARLAGLSVVAVLPDFVLLPPPNTPTLDLPITATAFDIANFSEVWTDNPASASVAHATSRSSVPSALTLRLSEYHGIAINVLPLLTSTLPQLEALTLLDVAKNVKHTKHSASQNQSMGEVQHDSSISDELIKLCDEHHIVVTPHATSLKPISNPSKHWLNFVQTKRTKFTSPYLQVAMLVLILAGLTQMLADGLQWYHYEQATVATKQANINQFEAWFTGETLNPRVTVQAQVEPRLSTKNTVEQSQLDLLNTVSPLIKQNNVVAKSLRWNGEQVMLTLTGKSREDIDNLQRTLTGQNITSNLGAITPTETGVQAELALPLARSATNEQSAGG